MLHRGGAASPAIAIEEIARPKPARLEAVLRMARQKPLGAASALIILALVFVAIFGTFIAPYSPYTMHDDARLVSPGARFWFGSDTLGRDVLSRIIYGARISLWVGVVSVGLGTSLGTVLGLICGFFEGKVDMVVQRIMDSLMAFPMLVLALAIMAVLGQSITNVMLAISIVIIPGASRIVRGTVLSVKQNPYVDAARAIGCDDLRILSRHILPNVLAPIIIIASVQLGGAILTEASLSFLGMGTPPPTPSWGGMLTGEGRRNLEKAPYLAVFPGLAISLAVMGFNLMGDALRDIWDPRLRGTR